MLSDSMGGRGHREKTSQWHNPQGEGAFRSSTLLASEAIARRNVAAIEADRIQTRCRDVGARAEASREVVSRENRSTPVRRSTEGGAPLRGGCVPRRGNCRERSRLRDWSSPASDPYRHSTADVSRCVTA